MDHQTIGKYILFAALFLAIIGIVYYFFGDKLGWIGNLPGDISIKKENFSFYFPLTTMILLSIIVSVLLRIFRNL